MSTTSKSGSPRKLSHAARIDRLGNVAVNIGLGLQPGQELIMSAPVEALPLVRAITEHAYKAGASAVHAFYNDEQATLARYKFAHDHSFDHAPNWLMDGMASAYRNGAARLAITGGHPSLLAGQDPAKVGRAMKAAGAAGRGVAQIIGGFEVNWSIVSFASPSWARTVFPHLPEKEAVKALWEAIFAASRVNGADPVAEWKAHNKALASRTSWLNAKRFATLHFKGPGTDLKVGLADDHTWCGGAEKAKNGIVCNPNIPTEEVFTTPHMLRTDGYVSSTKPLSNNGALMDGIRVRFEAGRIVEASATKGQDALDRMINSDEGARRLGEVALVPHSSPISASGVLFYNTLYDENAASHIALGRAYNTCITNGGNMSPEELASRGSNDSVIHVDWMIGSDKIDVDGINADGSVEPVMRKGEWAQ